MSISARFYTFSKKENSTATPTGGTSYNIVLKEPCSIIAPEILLECNNPSALNYAYIASFNRYYWVTDWVSDHGLWSAKLRVDPLASWKTDINSSYQFVDRAASKSNYHIIDPLYPMTVDMDQTNIDITFGLGNHKRPFMQSSNDIKYVCAVTNGADSSDVNPPPRNLEATYYYLSTGQLFALTQYLLKEPTYFSLNADVISDNVAKTICNPLEYFGETYVLPFDYYKFAPTGVAPVSCSFYCGWWPIDVDNAYLAMDHLAYTRKVLVARSNQIVIPSHPQAQAKGFYLNCAPYTQIQIFAGPFGFVTLDPFIAVNTPSFTFEIYSDFKGNAELDILYYDTETQANILWKRLYANVAVPFSVSQLSSDYGKALSGVGSGIGSIASGLVKSDPFSIISGAFNLVGSAASVMLPKHEGNATPPSIAYCMDNWYIQVEHHNITDIAINLKGAPLMEVNQLSDLNGFIQISDPVLDIAATADEINQIKTFMTGGMFLE